MVIPDWARKRSSNLLSYISVYIGNSQKSVARENPLWDPQNGRNSGARMRMTRVQLSLPGGRNSARLGSGSEPVAEYQRLCVPGAPGVIIPTLWTARTQKESSGTLDSSIFNIGRWRTANLDSGGWSRLQKDLWVKCLIYNEKMCFH